MSFIAEYIEQFNRHYPAKNVEVRSKIVRGELRFRVLINGSDDGMLLSEEDMRGAIRMFKRGGAK